MAWYDALLGPFRPHPRRLLMSADVAPAVVTPPATEPPASPWQRVFDSIYNRLSGLGGETDKGVAGQPQTDRTRLLDQQLAAIYRFNGYAARWVDIVPTEATRQGWSVVDSTDAVDAMASDNRRLYVESTIAEADTRARLYGASVILPVLDEDIPEGQASRWLSTPLDMRRVRRVLRLQVFDRTEMSIVAWGSDLRREDFGRPHLVAITPMNPGGGMMLTVHASRLLFFHGRQLPSYMRQQNGGWDDSVLDACWDAIRNRTSIDMAAALIAQELKVNVIKMEGLAQQQLSDAAETLYTRMAMIQRGKSLNNAVIMGEGESFEAVQTPMSGFEALDRNASDALCAQTGLSKALWYGDAPAGLNSDGQSHRALWINFLAGYQKTHYLDNLRYLYRMIYLSTEGPTKGVEPETWDVVFAALEQLSDVQQAAIRLVDAQRDAILVTQGIVTAEHIARSRYGSAGYQRELLPVDADDIPAGVSEEDLRAATEAELAALRAPPPVDDDVPPLPVDRQDDADVVALAQHMTELRLTSCEHGGVNRCRHCRIERVRGLDIDQGGAPVLDELGQPRWRVAWRPMRA